MSERGNTRRTKVLNNKEVEEFRHFHSGLLERCPRCGRIIFQPCLACLTELEGEVDDPFDAESGDPDLLRIQLDDEERRRYEYLHLEKIAETVRQGEQKDS
ncbi:MAG: hypothetical protein LBQ50_01235 [Planctomycetaceae bacterium]|jgi:hypothetical protein|nr:hypothetical protein [Planctomycetaceae bacterium]